LIERSRLQGIVVPMVTPFQPGGVTVHDAGIHQLVERLIGQGVHGVFVGGSMGEVWALDDAQWERLVRVAGEACRGRTPLYVGVSHPSTAGAAARTKRAAQLGADVVVALAPYYTQPSQAGIVRHFRALAEASDLPVLIYQFPGIVKTSITLATYMQLAEIPGVVGVKDSQADVTEFRSMVEMLRADGRDFRLFLGTDILTDVAVFLGAQGSVPSMGNIAAGLLVEAYEAAVAGDWAASAAANRRINALRAIYRVAATEAWFDGGLAGLKCALGLLGIEAGPPAPPLRPCDAQEAEVIAKILRSGGLL
jgi:4-hydroxy-tetrahydrodipicolinate synthase